MNKGFDGFDASKAFNEWRNKRPKTRNGEDVLPGARLLVSVNSVNSPSKAWRMIFTNAILNRITSYTNEYGHARSKSWCEIKKSDIIDFIAILLLMAVQKRKDNPKN